MQRIRRPTASIAVDRDVHIIWDSSLTRQLGVHTLALWAGVGPDVERISHVFLATELADEGVEGGCEYKAKTRHAHHAEQDRRTERLPHFRACSGRNGKRADAQNERKRGHQDRAKARAGGVHRGFAGGDTLLLFLPRELDDQDSVLGRQPDENNEADLRQDVDRHAAGEQACDGGEQTHRHDQDDRQRQLPAFVLGDENEEDEERGGAEDEKRRRAALLLLEREVCPFRSNAVREDLTGELLHAVQGGPSGDARGRYALHLGGRKKIVARHAVWDRFALELRHRPNRHHFAGCVAGLQAGDVL